MASALLINDVPIECINQAAIQYNVPATLIISVLQVEDGRAGMASPNDNGSFDYGPMQINSIWLRTLKPYGYTRDQLQNDPCTNVWVGTWILSQRIADSKEFWRGVASYHSYSIPQNTKYQQKVLKNYAKIIKYISGSDNIEQKMHLVAQEQKT